MQNLLTNAKQIIIMHLWQMYLDKSLLAQTINACIDQPFYLDHFALIDLPGPHSGISHLQQLFSLLGFDQAGAGYLTEKQNDFIWLCEKNCHDKKATEVLPQIVLADFRLHELPLKIRNIIEKYTQTIAPIPLADIEKLCLAVNRGDHTAQRELIATVIQQFKGRAWPTPCIKDYETVKEANELLAWVLIFGRQANHFGISVHLMSHFNTLKEFNDSLKINPGIQFNCRELEIKGNASLGIEQSSTADHLIQVALADGIIDIPGPFVEFVWRFPKINNSAPVLWKDYYTDFYAPNANHVVESVYQS